MGFLRESCAPGSGSASTNAGGRAWGVAVGVRAKGVGEAVGVGVFRLQACSDRSKAGNKTIIMNSLFRDFGERREERIGFSPLRMGKEPSLKNIITPGF
jgi:hypothetical protein